MTNSNEQPVATRLLEATDFAARKHRDQRRKGAEIDYVNHPLSVARTLVEVGGIDDATVLAAAMLHDTLEDTATTRDELEREFGAAVAGIVAEVTDDKRLPKDERKRRQIEHAPDLSPEAKLVKLADKICNLRDVLDAPPAGWPIERKRGYFDWAERVVDGLRGSNPRLEAVFDGLLERRDELR